MLFLLSGYGEMVNSFRRSTIAQNIGGVVVNAAAMFRTQASECAGIDHPVRARGGVEDSGKY